jgi:hypothetical protein
MLPLQDRSDNHLEDCFSFIGTGYSLQSQSFVLQNLRFIEYPPDTPSAGQFRELASIQIHKFIIEPTKNPNPSSDNGKLISAPHGNAIFAGKTIARFFFID